MADIYHITRKTDKQFLFEVQLNWLDQSFGTLHARDVNTGLLVATAPKLGGEGRDWSPEHLFLSSISSCYMSTMLLYAKKTVSKYYISIAMLSDKLNWWKENINSPM